MNNSEKSASGSPIFRYTDGEKQWESPHGEVHLNEITAHIEQYIGKVHNVFHEIISDTVHIDIHHVEPTKENPYHILVTSGMSDLPMNVPEGVETPKHLEVMITLPANWEINSDAFEKEEFYWPVRLLKFIARFPHKYDTWLGYGHTLPNYDPAEPYASNTKLNGAILIPPVTISSDFWTLPLENEEPIFFLSVVPLYGEEMKLKLDKGTDELLKRFQKNEITERVNTTRKNVAKKIFGLF